MLEYLKERTPDLRANERSDRSSAPGLWQLLNTPTQIDPAAMRIVCGVFLVAYAAVALVRYEESQQSFFVLRLLVCLYAAFGIWLAGRITWRRGRAYTTGLALLWPLQAAYIDGMLGNHVGEVALTTLATFVPLVFLQSGWDLVVVTLGLTAGHVGVLSVVPSPAIPMSVVVIMLGSAVATGASTALHSLVYRARWTLGLEQLEHALAVSAEWRSRYEAASLASRQLLYDWDPHTNAVSYGGAHERLLGYTAEELEGGLARWVELIHPDERDAVARDTRRALDEKLPVQLQYRVRRADGSYIVVEDSGHFVFDDDGRVVRLVGFVSDVTERTMAEAVRAEEAAASAALARVGRELISSLETPVVLERLCRLTTEVLDCDFSHTWLWNVEDGIYTPIASYGVPTEEWEAVRVLRVPSHPETPLFARLMRDEIAQVTADGTDHPVVAGLLSYYGVGVVLCTALRRGGEMVGIHVAGYRSRVPSFTAAQERIARGIAQLGSMALANARLVEQLEGASRLKSEFVSTMSHELRTPLNVILGYTDMLAGPLEPGEHEALLARVRQSALELLEMIEATLNLNRLAAGKDLPRLESVSLAELWDELETEFAAMPRSTAVVLRWTRVGVEALETDRRKLKMIVKNLVGNALKFTSDGEVVACIERSGERVAVTVRDTGIGIPPQHLPYIFDMFRQVDSSDKRSYGGAGLGLYIVRQLVDQLGATIMVHSTPGRGSTFRVVLPAMPQTGTAIAAA